MKIYFKEIVPKWFIDDFIKEAGIKEYLIQPLTERYNYKFADTMKAEYDYIVYIFSPELKQSHYYGEIAMEAFLDLETFAEKVIIVNLIGKEDDMMCYLCNKAYDLNGYQFDMLDKAANFIKNKIMDEDNEESHEQEHLNAFDEYQKKVIELDDMSDNSYFFLGLAGETGEVVEVYKKYLRIQNPTEEDTMNFFSKIKEELGDVIWYLSAIAGRCKIKLSEIVDFNLKKLNKRVEEGTLFDSDRNEQ